jgi:Mrp family chromosome partitioning ATPase
MGKFYKAIEKSRKQKGDTKDGSGSDPKAKVSETPERQTASSKLEQSSKPEAKESDALGLGSIHSLLDETEEIEFPGVDKTADIEANRTDEKPAKKDLSSIHSLIDESAAQTPPVDEAETSYRTKKQAETAEAVEPESVGETKHNSVGGDTESGREKPKEPLSDSKESSPVNAQESSDDEIIELEEASIIKTAGSKPAGDEADERAKPAPVKSKRPEKVKSKEKPKPAKQETAETTEKKIIQLKKKPVEELLLKQKKVEEETDSPPEEPALKSALQGIAYEKADPSLVTLLKPRSFESEQFKLLRTNLMFPVSGKPPRSLLVTSALPGDGKSFVTTNLAVSFAMNLDRHVLVIDADIRKPEIHSRFGIEARRGLSDFLTRNTPLPKLLMRTSLPNLTILPAGRPPHNPSELLSSVKMPKLSREVPRR